MEKWAGITSPDLDQLLPSQVAYRCERWAVRKIERLKGNDEGAWTR
jgi:hypothetical protein